MTAFSDISTYLISVVFGLYIGLLVIRLLLGFSRADFYNPVSQFIVSATNPVLLPLRKIMPSVGRYDTALIVIILVFKAIELFLLSSLSGHSANPVRLGLMAIIQTADFILLVYFVAIIIQVILSWVAMQNPMRQNPVISLLHQVTEPVLRPIRQLLPRTGMLDLSSLVAIIIITVLRKILYHLASGV